MPFALSVASELDVLTEPKKAKQTKSASLLLFLQTADWTKLPSRLGFHKSKHKIKSNRRGSLLQPLTPYY